MRVLHLNEWTQLKGGVEVYINQLKQLMDVRGLSTYVIGINNYSGYFTVTDDATNESFATRRQTEVFKFLEQFIDDKKIDLINIHNIFNTDLISFCLDRLPVVKFAHGPVMVCPGKDKFWRHSEEPCTIKYGAPCFWHIYSQGCSNRHPKRVLDAWNYVNYEVKVAANRYHRIVVMSDYIKDGLLECGVPERSIVCNPYFTPEINDTPEVLSGDRKSIVFIGRFVSSKGPHILLRALMPLLNKRVDIQLDIVGDGAMKDELKQIVKDAGLEDKITFHGWLARNGISKILDESYLVVFPSIYPEAFGIVGIEAMMHGKPVVGFDVGGVSTWLKNGVSGYLIANKDSDSFRDKTELLLDSPDIYSKMCINSRELALQKYIPSVHMKTLLGIYENALH
jgi:glycosyltransferase involved in cell wall biosynthesis